MPSFDDAAQQLFDEELGLSLIYNQQSSLEEFIQNILTHINGVMYVDFLTGKFNIKLIREPTAQELADALVLDESNVLDLADFERPSYAEMINEVVIRYRPQGEKEDSSLTLQNLASIQAQGAVVSQTENFPGVDNATIASIIGTRQLKQYSTPLAKVKIIANREAWNVRPGDIVNLSWDELGIQQLIVRIFSIDYGSLANGQIILNGTEDIYSLPQNSYVVDQPSDWNDPVQDPVPSPLVVMGELPYFEIANNFSQGDQSTFTEATAFLQVLALSPPVASSSYQLWLAGANIEALYEFDIDGNFTPSVTIVNDLDIPTTALEGNNQTIQIAGFTGLAALVEPNSYAYIGMEVIEVISIDLVNSELTIQRGVLDSVPHAHTAGDRIWFAEEGDTQGTQEYLTDPVSGTGDEIFGRFLTQTSLEILPISSSQTESVEFNGRQIRPFPPRNVQINGNLYPDYDNPGITGSTNVTWNSADRTLNITKPLFGFYSIIGSNAPEDNTTFRLEFYGELGTIIRTENIAGTAASAYAYNYSAADEIADSGLVGRLNDTLRLVITVIRNISGVGDIDSRDVYDHAWSRLLPPQN